MKAKAVSMDMKISPSNRTTPQDSDAGGGFSDILGNVSSDTRKQPGTSGSSRRDPAEGTGFRGEFRYTERASERTTDRRERTSLRRSSEKPEKHRMKAWSTSSCRRQPSS